VLATLALARVVIRDYVVSQNKNLGRNPSWSYVKPVVTRGSTVVDFINVLQILPRHVSASGCHLQGVLGALEANQAMSVLWAYTYYGPSSVASCRGNGNHLPKHVGVNLEHINKSN
jgi:hypothetical protein